MKKLSKNLKTVLEILKNEVDGDVESAMKKLTDDYSMTWMYKGKRTLFPKTKKSIEKELGAIYPIKNREYDIINIAENKNLIMLELIESYPDPKSKRVYRTPMVIVLEMKNGKIRTGRHYCDPRLSFLGLKKQQIKKALRKKTLLLIK